VGFDIDEAKLEDGEQADRPSPYDYGIGFDDSFGHGQLDLFLGNAHH
jgi:hypothetical protein